jgi:Uma2 family endonuclease
MPAVVIQGETMTIPSWVTDLNSFHRWTELDGFPEYGRICYLRGEVWVDMSEEQVFSHNQVKMEIYFVLMGLVRAGELGMLLGDGLRLAHPEADMSAVPDGTFISSETLQRLRVRLVEGARDGYVRVEGSPDMVLEVVSDSSVRKDTVRLRELYWKAGIREYWLVDARKEPLTFEILRRTARGYTATRKQDGWLKSVVFGKAFQLIQRTGGLGNPEYRLGVR